MKIQSDANIHNLLERVFYPQMEAIITSLDGSAGNKKSVAEALTKAKHLQEQFTLLRKESEEQQKNITIVTKFVYPESPLTKREMEVLALIQKGHTNGQIAEQLPCLVLQENHGHENGDCRGGGCQQGSPDLGNAPR